MHDDPLGLNRPESQSISEAWRLPEQEPTNLIALWPDAHAPTQPEIVAALENHWDHFELLEEIDADDPNIPWTIIVNAPPLHQPAVMWCEPARKLSPGELDDPRAEACPWSIGVESLLDHDDPLESFRKLACFLAAPFEDIPGILDVNTTGWIQRSRIVEQFLPEKNVPPTDVLWIIHAVSANDDDNCNRGTWLHTHGMWRCGRPELEILQVERSLISAAGQLLNDIAERIIDDPLPEPGESFLVGKNLSVTLMPWQDVASHLADGTPGNMTDRNQDDSGTHLGVRAVICADLPHDEPRNEWVWPKDAIERLENDEAVIYRSTRATRRSAMQAQYTWGELTSAFLKLQPYLPSQLDDPLAMVLLKVGYSYEADDSSELGAEHMWFEALRFEGDRVEGKLLNEPKFITSVKKDDVCWIEREQVSDWEVQTIEGQFRPDNILAMWQAVDAVTNNQESES